jgi:hypothetical protein
MDPILAAWHCGAGGPVPEAFDGKEAGPYADGLHATADYPEVRFVLVGKDGAVLDVNRQASRRARRCLNVVPFLTMIRVQAGAARTRRVLP